MTDLLFIHVQIKLSCAYLIKQYDMKAYGSGCIDPLFFYLGTSCGQLHASPALPPRKEPPVLIR
jgi:hypothetical protein